MIVVHHLDNSRSQRVLWLLEELGLAYEVKRYERDPKTMLAPPALRAIHPLGKSPVITDGDVVVAETGAIVTYLLERYGEGRLQPPAGTPEHRRFVYWIHAAEGSAMPPLLLKLILGRMPAGAPWYLRPFVRPVVAGALARYVDPSLERQKDFWEAELAAAPWFAGDVFTAADVMMSFPLEASARRSPFGAARPHLATFLATIHARPAFRRALERGGPYAYA